MAICVKCREEVAERAERCPHCGAPDPTNAFGDSLVAPPREEGGLAVEVRAINVPFSDLVVLLVKLSLAAVPALVILAIFWTIIIYLVQTLTT